MDILSKTRPERKTWTGVQKTQGSSLGTDSPRAIARRSIEAFHDARSRLSTGSSASYNPSRVWSPIASARTTRRKSEPKFINDDSKGPKEEDTLEWNKSDDCISIDANSDTITDGGEALRTEHWLRHQAFEDVLSIRSGEAAVAAEADAFKLGEDNVGISSSEVSAVCSCRPSATTQPKDTDYHPELRQRLKAACIRNLDGRSFIPFDRIYELITRETVTEELQRVAQHTDKPVALIRPIHQIAKDVCPADGDRTVHAQGEDDVPESRSRRKIFGVLVSMDMPASIEVFLDNNIFDVDLPLRITRHESTTQMTLSSGSKAKEIGRFLGGYNEFSCKSVEEFIDRQWEFIAPFFAPRLSEVLDSIPHYKLPRESILPWVDDDQSGDILSHEGGFGEVYRVRIHPSHHHFRDNSQSYMPTHFAIKSLPKIRDRSLTRAFEREASVLRKLTLQRKPHVVKLLATFEQGGSHHMIMEYANGGTLRDLWSNNKQQPQLNGSLMVSVIRQFTGLAEALERVHDYGRDTDGGKIYGMHGDIKPENILWFKPFDNGGFEQIGNDLGRLAIADFGLAKTSKSVDATRINAWTPTYRPPEAELFGQASQASDMWALGCVFVEFLVWMTAGWDGVEEGFPSARTTIVDPHDAQGKPILDDSFFTLEKDVPIVKPAVSDWMKVLSENPKCAPWMRDLLAVIGTSLLVVNPEARMSATQLAQTLKQMQDWGRSHPGYFTQGTAEGERMVVLPILLEHEEPESSIPGGVQHRKEIASDEANLESPAQTVESPPFTVQLMGMKQLPCSAKRHRQSMLDKLRLSVEGYLDEVIDWWPLRPLDLQKEQHTELRWEYGGEDMSIILNETETEQLNTEQNQAQDDSHPMNILPIAQPRSYQSKDAQAPSKFTAKKSFWLRWTQYINQLSNTSKPNPTGSSTSTRSTQMETYLCVDKCWTTMKDTRMRTVAAIDDMQSDFDFFCRARSLLNQAEGNWLQRKLSWRSYTSVTLSEFHFLFDDSDEVEVDGKPPPTDNDNFRRYHYTPIQGLGIDVQMRLCAKILLKGIAKPELGRGRRQLLDSMPKLLAPPGLNKKQFSGGWGFHARQGLCMRKTMGWIGAVLAFGIAFVPYWLCAIDELDLQTALAPASFLATALGVGLAMLAIAHTR